MSFLRSILDGFLNFLRTLFNPSRWASVPGKILQMSLPALVTWVVFVLLVAAAVIIGSLLVRRADISHAEWYRNIGLMSVLILVITIITYYTVKLWIEGETSPFEDIDRAWQAGIEALEQNQFNLQQIPLFLVLGSEGPEHERALFAASRLALTIEGAPAGAAALHWYANQDGIYLVLSNVGCLSVLARQASDVRLSQAAAPAAAAAPSLTTTAFPAAEPAPAVAAATGAAMSGDGPTFGGGSDIRGTMMVASVDIRETIRPTAAVRPGRSLELNRDAIEVQNARLAYLCNLINRARRPLCGVNGVMTLLPVRLISADNSEGAVTKEGVRSDLRVLMDRLKLRFPVITLMTGLEQEKGFDELIQRVGKERAVGQRFGKGFGVWDPPIDEEIGALCKHACGAFEDWTYYLFKEATALSKPGNRSLYSLLCKVRRVLQPRLEQVLVGGYSYDPELNDGTTPILFAGCYFAGTGDVPHRQAFVKGVFDRLPELQEELEWREDALREEGSYQLWSTIMFAAAGVLALGVAYFGWKLWSGPK